jgi:BolA protein
MASMSQRIEQLLMERFSPRVLSVMDDSAMHVGHAGARAGGESHFTVTVVSDVFAGHNPVARHRLVYDVLKPLMDEGLHALVIKAKTPQEDDAA